MPTIRFSMVLCLFLSCIAPGNSQSLPRKTAEQFFHQKLDRGKVPALFSFDEPTRIGDIWIFESRNPDGFVLVKESDSCRIAGYSTQNRLIRDQKIPEPALQFIEALSNISGKELNAGRFKTTYKPVAPLIRTKWSQEGYFNYYCPEDKNGPDGHVYAGCAAVAMGQIIRYYGKSNDFLVAAESIDPVYGTLNATVGNYDWTRMENQPITVDPEVSRFLYGLAVLLRMNFGPSGSTTSNFSVYDGFKKLKYFDAIRMIRSTTTPDVWIRNFTQNISDFQPVYVSGSGHSFVCDGMDADGLFHFNLGWYGYGDGYYPLNVILHINPSEAIFNIKPYSNNLPPANLYMDTTNGQRILRWEKNKLATINPSGYRVYLNDTLYYDNSNTYFNTLYMPAGNHDLMVSALYPQGESTWIGPIQYSIEGEQVNIDDPVLRLAIQEELIRENIEPVTAAPTINQLLRINRLEITQPLSTLSGLEHCKNLQVLTITPANPVSLDIGPISQLKRLKWLELKNIQATQPDLLTRNLSLIHLDLENFPADNLGFLASIPGLLSLKMVDTNISDATVFSQLQSLKNLTISGCSLGNASFAQDLGNLESLDLSRNLLTRFRLSAKLPSLHHLDISNNQISELFFLEYIPNIETLHIGMNQITRFVTGLNLKNLSELSMEFNSIDSLSMAIPMPQLTKLKVNGNKLRTVKYLRDYAPTLIELDLSANRIQDLWSGSLQSLEYLNVSANKLNLITDIPSNPLLKHIDLSNNQIADIYPIYDHSNSDKIQFLDLTGNPLSDESITVFTPFLQTVIDTMLLPENSQKFSPCNPLPERNLTVSGDTTILSWHSAELPTDGYYEVFTGPSRNRLTVAGQVKEPSFKLGLSRGQLYQWRVRTVLPDTSYFSGLFNFGTFERLSLPFKEDFEGYPAYTYLTGNAPFWITSQGGTASSFDGRIDPSRRYEGKQALKLPNSSDVKLPLSHLYQKNLYFSMQIMIEEGCYGSVRLNDINGTNLELYFKSNGRCDIFFNNRHHGEVNFKNGEWFPLQIDLYSGRQQIWINVGTTSIPIDWFFTGDLVHAGDIEWASSPGLNWPADGNPLFRVDLIQIKVYGAVGTGEVAIDRSLRIYPNPSTDYVIIESPPEAGKPDIRLYDFSGRRVDVPMAPEGDRRLRIGVSGLTPGIYIIRASCGGAAQTSRICISR